MTASSPARLSKPRLSALILEGTGAFVAVTLVLWLLLWFMWRLATSTPVAAFVVSVDDELAAEAPYQATDVRKLQGSATWDNRWAVKPSELPDRVAEAVRSSSTTVIYVTMPVLASASAGEPGRGTADPIESLAKTIAENAKGDVLLALDVGQVDSDRDLGIFGNSPLSTLPDRLAQLKPGKNVLILTSCAPAQKSWGADGLGQSAFAYYLRKGLEGDARGWDRSEERVTTLGLYRYVRAHVERWAQDQCRAVQTPMLIPVGGSERKFPLPRIAGYKDSPDEDTNETAAGQPVEPTASKEPSKSDQPTPSKKDVNAGEPAKVETAKKEPSPRESLRDQILDEWKEHDQLRAQHPYRTMPGAWRQYQSGLTQAERKVRVAWVDRERVPQAREAVDAIRETRKQLVSQLAKRGSDAASSAPFRPASDREGRQLVEDSVGLLTGRLGQSSQPVADPAKAAPSKGAGQGIATMLAEVAEGDYPRRYLELQLPIWAHRFTRKFAAPTYFQSDARADLLRQLVEVRKLAEGALATDDRGNPYIETLVARGDETRRRLQDQLFAVAEGEAVENGPFPRGLGTARQYYQAANDVAAAFHDARNTIERFAAEFPALAEWRIQSGSHSAGDRAASEGSLPTSVKAARDAARALVDALEQGFSKDQGDKAAQGWVEPLRQRTDVVKKALVALEADFAEGTRSGVTNDWITRDLALRSPLLGVDLRRDLLRRVLESGGEVRLPPPVGAGQDPPEEPPRDPGFWARAIGLAALDVAIDRLGNLNPDGQGREDSLHRIEESLPTRFETKQGRELAETLITPFNQFSTATQKARRQAADRPALSPRADQPLDDLHKAIRLADRQARLLSIGEIHLRESASIDGIDGPVTTYTRFGLYVTLAFHLSRLAEDYTSANFLDDLIEQVNNLADSIGWGAKLQGRPAGQYLSLRDDSKDSLLKMGSRAQADLQLQIGIKPTRATTGIGAVPEGLAFVGVLTGPDQPAQAKGQAWDLTQEGTEAGKSWKVLTSDRLLGQLQPVPPGLGAPATMSLHVAQRVLRNNPPPLNLTARLFYRGKVDPASESSVKILPNEFGELLEVKIRQNRDDLRNQYGEDLASRIADQFEKHPGLGAMHKGKSLAYVITIKNISPQSLKVRYQRFLSDPKAPKPEPLDPKPQLIEIEPGKSRTIPDAMTSEQVPVGSPKTLDLRLMAENENDKDLHDPLSVRFKQIEVKDYMNIEEKITPLPWKGGIEDCYAVYYRRRLDDPVTEPILDREISCVINEIPPEKRFTGYLFPGEEIVTKQPQDKTAKAWKWRGKIENEEVPQKP